jgi:hypothetical protein
MPHANEPKASNSRRIEGSESYIWASTVEACRLKHDGDTVVVQWSYFGADTYQHTRCNIIDDEGRHEELCVEVLFGDQFGLPGQGLVRQTSNTPSIASSAPVASNGSQAFPAPALAGPLGQLGPSSPSRGENLMRRIGELVLSVAQALDKEDTAAAGWAGHQVAMLPAPSVSPPTPHDTFPYPAGFPSVNVSTWSAVGMNGVNGTNGADGMEGANSANSVLSSSPQLSPSQTVGNKRRANSDLDIDSGGTAYSKRRHTAGGQAQAPPSMNQEQPLR